MRNSLYGRICRFIAARFAAGSHVLLCTALILTGLVVQAGSASADSLWSHNDSVVKLQETGGGVAIYYEDPSPLMREQGVIKGTALFEGTRTGDFVYGTARRFKKGCDQPYEYAVAGRLYRDGRSLTLWGKSSRRDSRCEVGTAEVSDELVFNAKQMESGRDDLGRTLLTPENSELSGRVMACFRDGVYGGGTVTVREMRLCSGFWITPRVLLHCALDGYCPAIEDTLVARQSVRQMLDQAGMTFDSPLVLQIEPALLPALPDKDQVLACRTGAVSPDTFERCVSLLSRKGRYDGLVKCSALTSERERLACLAEQVNNANLTGLLGCVANGNLRAEAILSCTPNQVIKADSERLRNCVSKAASLDLAVSCVTEALPPADRQLATCLTGAKTVTAVTGCLTERSPEASKAASVLQCIGEEDAFSCTRDLLPPEIRSLKDCFDTVTGEDGWINCATNNVPGFPVSDIASARECLRNAGDGTMRGLDCIGSAVGGDIGRATGCLAKSDALASGVCLVGGKDAQALGTYYACVRSGEDPAALIENCTDGILDAKTSQALACAYRSSGEISSLASCAAGAALPPEAARLAGCAASSTGATSFALCAAGPAMNEEWRIAAECAMQSGRGVEIALSNGLRHSALLFGESTGRAVVSFAAELEPEMRAAAKERGVPLEVVGRVGGDRLRISVRGGMLIDEPVAELTQLWRTAFAHALESADVL